MEARRFAMAVYETLQPIFDKIWQEFVVDGRKRAAIGEGLEETCVYRGNHDAHSDTRCAIGVCIPNNMYDPDLEGGQCNRRRSSQHA